MAGDLLVSTLLPRGLDVIAMPVGSAEQKCRAEAYDRKFEDAGMKHQESLNFENLVFAHYI